MIVWALVEMWLGSDVVRQLYGQDLTLRNA